MEGVNASLDRQAEMERQLSIHTLLFTAHMFRPATCRHVRSYGRSHVPARVGGADRGLLHDPDERRARVALVRLRGGCHIRKPMEAPCPTARAINNCAAWPMHRLQPCSGSPSPDHTLQALPGGGTRVQQHVSIRAPCLVRAEAILGRCARAPCLVRLHCLSISRQLGPTARADS